MILVVDASVALKWQFEDEEATERALAMLNEYVENAITLYRLPRRKSAIS